MLSIDIFCPIQCVHVDIDRHLPIIAQINRFARLSIDTYCSTYNSCSTVSIDIYRQCTMFKNVSIDAYCPFALSWKENDYLIVCSPNGSSFILLYIDYYRGMTCCGCLCLVALLAVHAFPTPAHIFSLHRVQIPKSQGEDIAADYWRVHSQVLALALRAVAQSVLVAPGLSSGNGTRNLHRDQVHAAKATLARSTRVEMCPFLERSTTLLLCWLPCFRWH